MTNCPIFRVLKLILMRIVISTFPNSLNKKFPRMWYKNNFFRILKFGKFPKKIIWRTAIKLWVLKIWEYLTILRINRLKKIRNFCKWFKKYRSLLKLWYLFNKEFSKMWCKKIYPSNFSLSQFTRNNWQTSKKSTKTSKKTLRGKMF